MFQPVLILPLICLQQFVILIVPIAFATSRHLACFPTALVFVIYANQRTKTFHQIVLEGTFINTAIAVLNSAFTVPCILVELAFIDRSVFIACFSLAGEESTWPHPRQFSFRRVLFVSPFSIRLVAPPQTLVAVSISRDHPPAALPYPISLDISLVEISVLVHNDGFCSCVERGYFSDEGEFSLLGELISVYFIAVFWFFAVDIPDFRMGFQKV